eukprot:TRINITY_DN21353_c1_g2_i1.p1 TRINITY_DN21353_c1_g2~~TRINITY_DN21353_c1_g2_i1.p1  ORF type:complete len:154 (-),score=21.46 TRINITY_DN21353_c1_g2_i1:97-558(-)
MQMALRVLAILMMTRVFSIFGADVCEMAYDADSSKTRNDTCYGVDDTETARGKACAGKGSSDPCEDYVHRVATMHRRRSDGCYKHTYKGGRCVMSPGYLCVLRRKQNCQGYLPTPKFVCDGATPSCYEDTTTNMATPVAHATIALTLPVLALL